MGRRMMRIGQRSPAMLQQVGRLMSCWLGRRIMMKGDRYSAKLQQVMSYRASGWGGEL